MMLTYSDYAAMPDDGHRYELIDGELIMAPAPGSPHQWVSRRLLRLLDEHIERQGIGVLFNAPFDVILHERNVVQPDLVYLDLSRRGLLRQKGIVGAPTLLVEILSPSNEAYDRRRKRQLYARFEVPHYWIVDPEAKTIEALAWTPAGYVRAAFFSGAEIAHLPPFPDLAVDLAQIWPPKIPE